MSIPTLAITVHGAVAPSYEDVLAGVEQAFRDALGDDLVIAGQDAAFTAMLADQINQANLLGKALYDAYPVSAMPGALLSNALLVNGLQRVGPRRSTWRVDLTSSTGKDEIIDLTGLQVIIDDAGTPILFDLPAITLTVRADQSTLVTMTAVEPGPLVMLSSSQLVRPRVVGSSKLNVLAAAVNAPTPGAFTESDGEVRDRYAASTMVASSATLDSIAAAVNNHPQLSAAVVLENDRNTGSVLPAHSLSVIVQARDTDETARQLANEVRLRKPPGIRLVNFTYPITSTFDDQAVTLTRVWSESVFIAAELTENTGFLLDTADVIRLAVRDYVNTQPIGATLYYAGFQPALNLLNTSAVRNATGKTAAELARYRAGYTVFSYTIKTASNPNPHNDDVVLPPSYRPILYEPIQVT